MLYQIAESGSGARLYASAPSGNAREKGRFELK
jgi:hypothetical protein